MSVNRAILLGECADDPIIHAFANESRVANLVLITSEKWTDRKTGEEKSRHERHKLAVFNDSLVDLIAQHVQKGDKLYVEGQIESRTWTDSDGVQRSSVDIVIRRQKGIVVLMG